MAGVAVVTTSRRDMKDREQAKKDRLSSLVVDFSENGGGTVRCIKASEGSPFGGEPKTYSFESPESLNQFVASKIMGTASAEPVAEVVEETPAGDIAEVAEVAGGPVDDGDDYL